MHRLAGRCALARWSPAGIIAHPYVGRNEEAVQWVAQEDWIVSRDFDMPDVLRPEGGWYLDIDYLDTVADVRVNGDTGACRRATVSAATGPMFRML